MSENENNKNVDTNTVVNTNNSNTIFEENGTFCRVGSVDTGILEVDLQSIKQKGIEMRNISFAIPIGVDENKNPIKAEMLFMDENSFNKFKAFISKLNWND